MNKKTEKKIRIRLTNLLVSEYENKLAGNPLTVEDTSSTAPPI